MRKLSVIIPVSRHEHTYLIKKSIYHFSSVDFSGFDETIIYAIDNGRDSRDYADIDVPDNTVLLFSDNPHLKQAGGYNAGLDYCVFDYVSFFDIDAVPAIDFFQECTKVDKGFVTCDRLVLNPYVNSTTETISEEYKFCNTSRRFLDKYVGKYHPASCTGLVKAVIFDSFRFDESTGADLELYRHILKKRFTMGYTTKTFYMEMSPVSTDELDKQRIRWFQDIYRTYFKMCNIGTWKENVATLVMFLVVMFPIFTIPVATLYMEHAWGYNLITHTFEMQKISLRALLRTIFGKGVSWDVTKK